MAAPTADPASGTIVAANSTVTLGTTTAGATIYYTTDGNDPTTSSQSGTSVTITGAPGETVTVKAYAVKDGMADSEVATFTYTLQGQVAAPTADPASGTIVAANSTVTLSTATADAKIYYTTNGEDPTEASKEYTGPITITEGVTIKAIAVKDGMEDSEVASFTYTLQGQVAAPTADPVSGTTVAANSTVTLSTATADAKIYYTTNGEDPTEASTEYTGPITITEGVTIKAFAVKDGLAASAVSTFTYTLQGQVAAPTANPSSGSTVANNSTVTLNTTTADTTIYYTTNGNDPTTSSQSGTSVTITGAPGATVTVKAFAVKDGMEDSEVATFTYTLQGQVAAPTANPSSGTTVAANSTVTLSTATADAKIYYTTNGEDPTEASTEYTGPITITEGVTIKAFAVKDGMAASAVSTFTYTLQGQVAAPVADPASGTIVAANSTVTLSTATADAKIYYTTNGEDPT
ncbi:MAG TPA: chitobiase/beta-hexosaminidase C-terminal domain-containing protein, partial [Paenibacillus sp.]|nr:chitobiase/beta-hexosaminidase C-terminal domain-containing protein [Paenibacillus sp.]